MDANTNTSDESINNHEDKASLGISKRPLFQRILFEVCFVVYAAITNLSIPLVQQYLYFIVNRKYSSHDINNSSSNETVNPLIEEETTRLVLYLNMLELFPTAVVVLIMGFCSDIIGERRALIWFPCLGNVVYGLGFLLPLYISNGDVDHPATKPLLYCCTLFYGLTGNTATYTVGISSYISDTDTVKQRNLRLSILQMNYCFTYGIVNYANSLWLNATENFKMPLYIYLVSSVIVGILYFAFLEEPNHPDIQKINEKGNKYNMKAVKNLFRLDTNQHRAMWCVLIAFILYCFVQQGQERTTVIFLKNEPLQWSDNHIGLYFLVTYVLSGFGIIPGTLLLERYFSEISVTIIGMISFSVGSLMLGFVRSPTLIYVSCVLKLFHQIPWSYARSITSKQASETEQASIYTLLHGSQLWMLFLGATSYNAMFFATLQWMNGFVFVISAVLLMPSLLLLYYAMYVLTKKPSQMRMGINETDNLTESANLINHQ